MKSSGKKDMKKKVMKHIEKDMKIEKKEITADKKLAKSLKK